MKQVLILRHAKSSWKNQNIADFDRPLSKRGIHDAPRMGKLLAEQDLIPDWMISSSAKRAMLTAEAVAEGCGYQGEIAAKKELYMAMPDTYLAVIRETPDSVSSILLVGHNPGMEDLVEELTGEWVRMPTAALAQVSLPLNRWQDLGSETDGKLLNLWLPKQL